VRGSSENAGVVKDLLQSLVMRGIDASAQRLFVIDGSKAIRSAIEQARPTAKSCALVLDAVLRRLVRRLRASS
jgi:hypothetical protein